MVEVEIIIPGQPVTIAAAAPPVPKPEAAPAVAQTPAAEIPPAPSAAPAQIPVATGAAGYFLQVGAFGSKENAESFLSRMKVQLDGLADGLHIFTRDGLFRVHAGPYASDGEARQAADRISQALGVRPFVLTR